jgi:tripartite-type tricarboxylate transporter receptor subunit TctC
MKHLSRRLFARHLSLTAAALVLPGLGRAQTDGSVGKIIVGYPPGGTLDQTARRVSEAWRVQGKAYIVDNRAGAAGRIANGQLKRERADGSMLLCTHTSALTIYPHVYAKLGYNSATDFRPVSPIAAATCAFAVSSAVPDSVRTLADYVRWVKATPAAASYASPAAGSMAHFLGYRFDQAASLKLTHVGYRGSAPAMQDLLGGQIPAYLGFVGDFLQYTASGKLRILAVTSDKRSRFMPEVPTFAEQGFATVTGTESYGLFAPPQTPDAVLAALGEATKTASKDATLMAGFAQIGMDSIAMTPTAYSQLIAREFEYWRPIVLASGFRSEE